MNKIIKTNFERMNWLQLMNSYHNYYFFLTITNIQPCKVRLGCEGCMAVVALNASVSILL